MTIFLLGSQATGADQKESESGGPPAVGEHVDLGELARHLNNPVNSVWNIVTQNNFYFLKGFPSSAYRGEYVMNFQPVLPIPLRGPFAFAFYKSPEE